MFKKVALPVCGRYNSKPVSQQIGTCRGCLPSTSSRIKSCAAALQHSLKEVEVESRNETLCAPRKLTEDVFR